MTDRSALVREIQQSRDNGLRLTRAVAALETFDRQAAASAAAGRETDLGAEIVAHRMEPRTAHELHTAATDWLADFRDPGEGDFRVAMVSEAAVWYRALDPAVRQDGEELGLQARGRAHTLASAYGSKAPAAEREFLGYVGYLHQGASGLPQIDQTVDPNNAPSQTPYPTEVFPTFGEEQDQFNQVEDNNHGSQISSDGAPLIQQVEQQNGGGSGFGSGPEKPDEHSTGFDTSNSYAEVPLGQPGTLPTAPAATDSAGSSAPNPVAGQPQDAGADRRQAARIEGYSAPDPFGYRWLTTGEVMHPFHEKCASAHWPEEGCTGGSEHTASVAIGYAMDLDTARRLAGLEELGAREGRRAVQGVRSLDELGARHNRVTAGWGASDRTAEDTAVLHGFMAVVRPVLARDFTRDERAAAEKKGDALPGGKLPIENKGDLENAERLKGKVKGVPRSEVDSYVDRKEHEFGKSGRRLDFSRAAEAALTKGAPFAGYADFQSCIRVNQDKDDPDAYCGAIRHQAEGASREAAVPSPACPKCHSKNVKLSRGDGKNQIHCNDCGNDQAYGQPAEIMHHHGASGLDQVQQVTDPNNAPAPQDDDLPEGVAFPLSEAWTQQWTTGPQGAVPAGGKQQVQAAGLTGLPEAHARIFGNMDALDGKKPYHKDDYPWSARSHGAYLRSYNGVHAATYSGTPMTRESYGEMTGRPDLFPHWQDARDQAQKARSVRATASARTAADSGTGGSPEEPHCTDCGHKPGCDCPHKCVYGERTDLHGQRTARVVRADTMTAPHATTDDAAPPFNTPATAPDPASSNAMPQDADYAAGAAAGRADKAAGERPAFADNSSGVSPYVKGYAAEYGAAQAPSGPQDVPASIGGDSGQAMNDTEAQRAFQVAKASRVSDAFVPAQLHDDPDFRKGYGFASAWVPRVALVTTGSAAFEAGLYAGITDRPEIQDRWLAWHAIRADEHPELGRRVALHRSFSRKTGYRNEGLRAQGAYLVRRAGTSTDLITDGPGTSPDPMGATPLNGPGQPPPMGGLDEAATPGGPGPYQGAPPLPGGPVVPDDVLGKPQRPEQKDGPFTNTFSGDHPENATLAPVAPNTANQEGYSNPDAYAGDPHGSDRMAVFRARVQASLSSGLGAGLISGEAGS
jgi:hypothetical protein